MSELIDIFSSIKDTVYKHNTQKYDMESIFKRCRDNQDKEFTEKVYLYVFGMHSSLESIGTNIIEMQKIDLKDIKSMISNQNKFESILKTIFVLVDNFIDSITAFSRLYQIKNQEYDFIRTIMELRAKRDLLIKIQAEYMSKLIKGSTDSGELQFFLSDFLDSLINEGYRLQINKLLNILTSVLDKQNAIEEIW